MGRRKKKVVTEEVKTVTVDETTPVLQAVEIPDIQLEVPSAPDIDVFIGTSINKDCVCDEPVTEPLSSPDIEAEALPVVEVKPEVTRDEIVSAPIDTPKVTVTEALDVFPGEVSAKEKVENKVKQMVKTSTDMKNANKLQKLRMISARLRSNRVKSLPIRRHNTINAKFSIK